jgi:acetyltransferase
VARAFAAYSGLNKSSKNIKLKGPRIAIITNAGGPAVMATDQIEKSKILQMAQFSQETIARLRTGFPPGAGFYNPIDVIADATSERYTLALEAMHADKNVDGILAILLPASKEKQPESIAQAIVDMFQKSQKPILACFMGGEIASRGVAIVKQAGIPCYAYPEQAIGAFKAMFQHYSWQNKPVPAEIKSVSKPQPGLKKLLEPSKQALTTDEVLRIINGYDIAIPEFKLAQSLGQAVSDAEQIGFPVALKIVSAEMTHKTDVGGVKLNIHTPAELNKAWREIMESAGQFSPAASIKGIMVQKMITGGQEIIIGVSRDRQFGHLVMFGLGGIYVEVLKDVSFRLAPLKMANVEAMIREIRTYPLLRGIRGEEPSDLQNLKETILKISQLVTDFPQIAELDINPYKLFAKGGTAIDARITVS